MGLQELHERAEWYSLPDAKRTSFQRLAARTQGILTIANAVSVAGAVLTVVGLSFFYRQFYALGIALCGIGRFCDILDGHIARATHTTSPIGEAVDAFFDKLVVFSGCVLLIYMNVIPALLGIPLLIIQLAIAVLALVVRHDGTGLHPLRIGKYAMFGLWVAIGLFMAAHIMTGITAANFVWNGAFLLLIVVLGAELMALRGYVRVIVRKHLLNR